MRLYFSRPEQYAVAILLVAMLGALAVLGYSYGKKHTALQRDPLPPFLEQQATASTVATPQADNTRELVVHVAGAVKSTGIYTLPAGSRIHEAIAKAGGAREDGYPDALNLAAVAEDGQRIWVPTRAEWEKSQQGAKVEEWVTTQPAATPTQKTVKSPATVPTAADSGERPSGPKVNPTGKISLNTATVDDLTQIRGIGPVTAQRIIDYRVAHGKFTDMAQLLDVSGIGPKTFEKISPYLSL